MELCAAVGRWADAVTVSAADKKFGDDNEAIQLFNIGELNILSAHDVTDAQISAVMTAKMANRRKTVCSGAVSRS